MCRAVPSTVVRRRRKFGEGLLYGVREWLWIDSNGKIETRLPVEGSFANKFPSIHNHCGVMASGSRKIAKIFIFDVFGETRPLMGNFSRFCSDVIYRDTDRRVVFEFREIWSTENRSNRALLTWQKKTKICSASISRYCSDRAQNVPGPAHENALGVLQISPKSAHFWQSYTQTREYHHNGP